MSSVKLNNDQENSQPAELVTEPSSDKIVSFQEAKRLRDLRKTCAELSKETGFDCSIFAEVINWRVKQKLGKPTTPLPDFEDLPDDHNAKIRWRLAQLAIESGLFTYDPITEVDYYSTYYFEYSEKFEVPSLGARVSVDLKLDIPEDGAEEEAIFYISVFPNEGVSISYLEVHLFVRRFLGLPTAVNFVYVYLADHGYTAVVQNFIEDSDTNEAMVKKCIQSLRESVTAVSPSERKT